MKIYNVVLETNTQENKKFKTTILNSFDDLNKAKTFMRTEARKTMSCLGSSLLDNFLVGNCKCESTKESVSVYCSNGNEDGPFDEYNYSIEELDIEPSSIPPIYVLSQKTHINYYTEYKILKLFISKSEAENYKNKIMKDIIHNQDTTLSTYYNDRIIYNNSNDYIEFSIECFKTE